MKCWFCREKLIWQSDFSFEDYGLDNEGIVTVLYCPNCKTTWEGYLNLDKENIKDRNN